MNGVEEKLIRNSPNILQKYFSEDVCVSVLGKENDRSLRKFIFIVDIFGALVL